jgi:hypothetical protein
MASLTNEELQSIQTDPKNRLASSELLLRLIWEYSKLRDAAEERETDPAMRDYAKLEAQHERLKSDLARLVNKHIPGFGHPIG